MIKVKPGPGLKIRDPLTHLFIDDKDGLEVDEKSLYWFKRLRDKDVVPFDEGNASDISGTKGSKGAKAADTASTGS